MTLKDCIAQSNHNPKVSEDRSGLSAPAVFRARDGINIPSRRTLQVIVTATGRAVSIQDLIPVEERE
jgi:hypothetical protein